MKKTAKITIIVFAILVAAAAPLYVYTRPAATQKGTIQISGNVNNPVSLNFSQLEAYPSSTVQVTLTSSSNPSDNGDYSYTGVPLKDLLDQAQVASNATSVYIQASDGYGAMLTLEEAMAQNTIIAYAKDCVALTALQNGGEGPARLVIGGDQYAQRFTPLCQIKFEFKSKVPPRRS